MTLDEGLQKRIFQEWTRYAFVYMQNVKYLIL